MDKVIDLAKKLKALADRGVGGERENADQMLKRHLDKHGITLESIEKEEIRAFSIKPKFKQMTILHQIIVMVLGKSAKIFGSKRSKTEVIFDCTPAQFIEIEAAFEFYWMAYEAELKLFTKAFIYKNDLLPHDAGTGSSSLSPEERLKLISMMGGIDKKTMYKQLQSNH